MQSRKAVDSNAHRPMSPGKAADWEQFAADWEQLAKELFPEADPDVDRLAGVHIPTVREAAVRSSEQEPLRSGKFPSIAKRTRFGVLYVAIIASASVAGLSIVRQGRDAEPIVVPIPPYVSGGTEVAAILGSSAARSEAFPEALKPTQQVVSVDAPQAPQSSSPAEADSAVSDFPQTVTAGIRAKVSAEQLEIEISEKSDAGQRDTSEKLNDAEAASPEPDRAPAQWVAQSPSGGGREEAAGAAPQSDMGQPDVGDLLGAAHTAAADTTMLREEPSAARARAAQTAHTSELAPSGGAREEAAGSASHSDTGQPDVGKLLETAGAAAADTTVFPEEPSTAPAQAAQTAYNSEPASRRPGEPVGVVTPAPETAEGVGMGPQTPDLGSATASETEHRPEEPHPSVADTANLREAALARSPEAVLPPAVKTAPENQRFTDAEVDILLARGDAFFATGDLTSARLFYEYAAAAGNGTAALRLGGTFDPAFLARAHVGRVQGDMPTALYWYRRARDLGDADAETLIRGVENITR